MISHGEVPDLLEQCSGIDTFTKALRAALISLSRDRTGAAGFVTEPEQAGYGRAGMPQATLVRRFVHLPGVPPWPADGPCGENVAQPARSSLRIRPCGCGRKVFAMMANAPARRRHEHGA
jgi:hypothetical protein